MMKLFASPKAWIAIAALVGLIYRGVPGVLIGAVLGFIVTIVFGLLVNAFSGGAVPRGVRRALVTNVLADDPETVRRAFPGLEGNDLFRAIEDEVERIIRKAVTLSPSHQAIYSQVVVLSAAVLVAEEKPDPAYQALIRTIAARLRQDWYSGVHGGVRQL